MCMLYLLSRLHVVLIKYLTLGGNIAEARNHVTQSLKTTLVASRLHVVLIKYLTLGGNIAEARNHVT